MKKGQKRLIEIIVEYVKPVNYSLCCKGCVEGLAQKISDEFTQKK